MHYSPRLGIEQRLALLLEPVAEAAEAEDPQLSMPPEHLPPGAVHLLLVVVLVRGRSVAELSLPGSPFLVGLELVLALERLQLLLLPLPQLLVEPRPSLLDFW
jgi:hypothetical protein